VVCIGHLSVGRGSGTAAGSLAWEGTTGVFPTKGRWSGLVRAFFKRGFAGGCGARGWEGYFDWRMLSFGFCRAHGAAENGGKLSGGDGLWKLAGAGAFGDFGRVLSLES